MEVTARIVELEQQVAALTQREANYHALLSDLNSVTELRDDLQTRLYALLVDCDNPQCDITNALDEKLVAAEERAEAAEQQVAALQREKDELQEQLARVDSL